MKRLFVICSVVGLLLILLSCGKNPTEDIDNQELTSASEAANKIPSKLVLQGRIVFGDGTVYESSVKKEFDLPERFWPTLTKLGVSSDVPIELAKLGGGNKILTDYSYGWGANYFEIAPGSQAEFYQLNAGFTCHWIWLNRPHCYVNESYQGSFFMQSYWEDDYTSSYSPGNTYSQMSAGDYSGTFSYYQTYDFRYSVPGIDKIGIKFQNNGTTQSIFISNPLVTMRAYSPCY